MHVGNERKRRPTEKAELRKLTVAVYVYFDVILQSMNWYKETVIYIYDTGICFSSLWMMAKQPFSLLMKHSTGNYTIIYYFSFYGLFTFQVYRIHLKQILKN